VRQLKEEGAAQDTRPKQKPVSDQPKLTSPMRGALSPMHQTTCNTEHDPTQPHLRYVRAIRTHCDRSVCAPTYRPEPCGRPPAHADGTHGVGGRRCGRPAAARRRSSRACNRRHTGCDMQHATHRLQHATYETQNATCNMAATTCNVQHARRCGSGSAVRARAPAAV
jgi:hypothetical protein